MESKITYYDEKVSRIIASVYLGDKKNELLLAYAHSKEIESKALEIGNLLLCFSSEEDKKFLKEENIPLFELEVIYKIVENEIVRYVNFINLKPNVKGDEGMFKQLQYCLMQVQVIVDKTDKIGRNELCPCKSGRKFKHCHGQE